MFLLFNNIANSSETADLSDNKTCLKCHEYGADTITHEVEEEEVDLLQIDQKRFKKAIHNKLLCIDCHTNILEVPEDNKGEHKKDVNIENPSCITCHEELAKKGKKLDRSDEILAVIEDWKKSNHARPDKNRENTPPRAVCEDCHHPHFFDVPKPASSDFKKWAKNVAGACSKCHEDQVEEMEESVHNKILVQEGRGATCSSCHIAHKVTSASSRNFKNDLTYQCRDCHPKEFNSYSDTYHGKINKLGSKQSITCIDCHGTHLILNAYNKEAMHNPKNKLETCKSCHDGKKALLASDGFASFAPHANTHDFENYPMMFIIGLFMKLLIIGVFAFFWLHSILWFIREWIERKNPPAKTHIDIKTLGIENGRHFERFSWGWRLGHLLLAISCILLTLTGMVPMFAQNSWTPKLASMLGGPEFMAIIHRISAGILFIAFFGHLIFVTINIFKTKGGFKWFGADSMLPNIKDVLDVIGMIKWFFFLGDRPKFERFTYYEKFDYWAVFWGMFIIGGSGLVLAFPGFVGTYLPGWIFNVSALVHGEEAILAATFLFTVHYFNSHFRPDKLPPPDIVMFTGVQSLEEFAHEHPAYYQRMVTSGEITKYMVPAPSAIMTSFSKWLGIVLIVFGLLLLLLVFMGFFVK